MILRPLGELTKGRLREFFREPSAFLFVLLMPIMWLVILDFAFQEAPNSSSAKDIKIGFLIPVEPSEFSNRVQETLAAAYPNFASSNDLKTLDDQLHHQKLDLILTASPPDEVQVSYEPKSGEAKALIVYDELEKSLGRENKLKAHIAPATQPGGYLAFFVPGLLGMSIFMTSLFGIGMTIVSNRRGHLLKRFLLTPMRPSLYITSHLIGRMVILALELTVVLGFAKAVYGIAPTGSLFSFILVAVLGALTCASLAILCGSRMKNTSGYSGAVNLLAVPMMLLSGVWFSRASFPAWLSTLTDYLPLTALVEGLRKISYEGAGLCEVFPQLAVLLGYLIVTSLLAKKLFKWT